MTEQRAAGGRAAGGSSSLSTPTGRPHGALDGVDLAPRLGILNVLATYTVLEPQGVTSTMLGERLGKSPATIDQMLYALRADRLVEFVQRGRTRLWHRTETGIPEHFTSTATARDVDAFTDKALREAMGIPLDPPRPKGVSRVVQLEK